MSQGFNFLGDSFSNRYNVGDPIQFRRESQPKHIKKYDLKFHKFVKIIMPNSVESLGYISNATAQVIPDLLKGLAILSDTTVRRPAVDRENLKPYWKSERRPYFSRKSTIPSNNLENKTPSDTY